MQRSTGIVRRRRRILAIVAAAAAIAFPITSTTASQAATTVALSVNLASVTGTSTGIGQGVLYGVSQDATQPADRFIAPLKLNAFRGGGHASGDWIHDGYTYGSGTQSEVAEAIAQAKRLKALNPSGVQYQFILSDAFGATGGQPSNTVYPCTNGDCSNWVAFIDAVVKPLQASGYTFAYDIWNEPDGSAFWPNGSVNSTQYFQMWDSAVKELRSVAPSALIVGPSFAQTPSNNTAEWNTFLAHVKSAGTAPDWITTHNESGDDPVTEGNTISTLLSNNGISARPLSSNEYQAVNQQTANVTAWEIDRFRQSKYTNAMRGNWNCCSTPNLTGLLNDAGTATNGNWWVMRAAADMTGSLVTTSGQVGTTAIEASIDSTAKRAMALVGDFSGATGTANVTFSGLASTTWLQSGGKVNVVVDRIADGTLAAPQVVTNTNVSASSGSFTVPVTLQASGDAYAIYLTPAGRSGALTGTASGRCLDVPGADQTLGVQADIWDCNGQTNQQWHATAAGELRTFNDTECLDAANNGTANGTKVVLWYCNGQSNQQWTVNSNGTVVNTASGRCLDVNLAATANGSTLILYDCNGQTNQKWTLPSNN